MDRQQNNSQPLALSLSVLAALVRLVPHPPNFAPLGATALFAGARVSGWQAYLVPLLAMLATDPIRSRLEGGYAPYSAMTPVIYGCFLISVFLGRTFLKNESGPARIAGITLAGSLQFFVITNLFVWVRMSDVYPRNWAGLTECFVAALPFLGRTVFSDLFFTAVLFSAYYLLARRLNPSVIRSATPQ